MRRPDRTTLALAGVLLGALALRLWGIRHGLPFSYNIDEEGHFVPVAIGFFGHDLNPGYFLNPPGYTELLYASTPSGSAARDAVAARLRDDPGEVFLIARVTVALLGTLAVWLLHVAGARLFDRRVGLLAAALGAVAFLPVFYGHLALNDVPAMAPATLALLGDRAACCAAAARARPRSAGSAPGLAAGTKYTAGIALLPLLSAIARAARERRGAVRARRARLVARGLRRRARRLPGREPVRAARLRAPSTRASPDSADSRAGRSWRSSASRSATGSSTTCGR